MGKALLVYYIYIYIIVKYDRFLDPPLRVLEGSNISAVMCVALTYTHRILKKSNRFFTVLYRSMPFVMNSAFVEKMNQ